MTTPREDQAPSPSNPPPFHSEEFPHLTGAKPIFSHISIMNQGVLSPAPHQHMEAFFAQSPRRYAVVYLDDIVMFSASFALHMSDMHDVLGLMLRLGVKMNDKTSAFCQAGRRFGVGGEVVGDEGVPAEEEGVPAEEE
ncbi:hypothetical protein VE03_01404 [Pseudogymnoascus sp. 23342-1-I1]|nr:hypothetical protein VE03_01404 [Pseudogymnoascus sp. 23342-1-I1]